MSLDESICEHGEPVVFANNSGMRSMMFPVYKFLNTVSRADRANTTPKAVITISMDNGPWLSREHT